MITAEHATFIGAAAILDAQLRALKTAPGAAILGQIRRARNALSPAELRVAEHVLTHPRAVVNDPIAAIAAAAQVSQPTVIRFCRSLGCEGLSDFKLRLASGLTGTVPVTHTQVTNDDSMLELGAKVLGNTASAILQVRSQLSREMIDRAIALLFDAERVEFLRPGMTAWWRKTRSSSSCAWACRAAPAPTRASSCWPPAYSNRAMSRSSSAAVAARRSCSRWWRKRIGAARR